MKIQALIVPAFLLLAGLAMPGAQAIPPVCIGPETHETIGPVTVESYGVNCTTVTVDKAQACKDNTYYGQFYTVYTFRDCSTRVDIKFYDCVWNCGWVTIVKAPKLTVRYFTETYGQDKAATPCVTKDASVKNIDASVTGGVGVGCWAYSVNATGQGYPIECQGSVKPQCEDIYINWMACLWGGSYKAVRTGVNTVYVYTCDNRPPSNMALDPNSAGAEVCIEAAPLAKCLASPEAGCLGGLRATEKEIARGGVTVTIHRCVPGPNPGPAI